MTKAEAISFLTGITPVNVDMVTLDAVLWADFKASMLAILSDPTVDPKYRTAVEQINALADSALG